MGLQLLPGEKEELHLHPAPSSFFARQLWALGLVLYGGILWSVFHAPWWTGHNPSDWTAAWTWLWGTSTAAYLWTLGGLALGGAVASLPRGPWTRLWVALAAGGAVALVTRIGFRNNPADWLPLLTMGAAIPALAWIETRRLGTSYHVTNLRLVVRTVLPRRTERSILYTDLVDLDARTSPWPDTGILIPVTAKQGAAENGAKDDDDAQGPALKPAPPIRMVGVRPFRRVRSLIELLAQRATASEYVKTESGLDGQVAEALAALHRH